MGKRLFVVLVVVAILGLQFADCMSAMTQDQQSMKCCGTMPCDPSNQSHDCCKAMVSSQSPSVLPVAHVTFFSSSRRRHTRCLSDWSSDVCSSDLAEWGHQGGNGFHRDTRHERLPGGHPALRPARAISRALEAGEDLVMHVGPLAARGVERSEERRVGKECRSRWWPYR